MCGAVHLHVNAYRSVSLFIHQTIGHPYDEPRDIPGQLPVRGITRFGQRQTNLHPCIDS